MPPRAFGENGSRRTGNDVRVRNYNKDNEAVSRLSGRVGEAKAGSLYGTSDFLSTLFDDEETRVLRTCIVWLLIAVQPGMVQTKLHQSVKGEYVKIISIGASLSLDVVSEDAL